MDVPFLLEMNCGWVRNDFLFFSSPGPFLQVVCWLDARHRMVIPDEDLNLLLSRRRLLHAAADTILKKNKDGCTMDRKMPCQIGRIQTTAEKRTPFTLCRRHFCSCVLWSRRRMGIKRLRHGANLVPAVGRCILTSSF